MNRSRNQLDAYPTRNLSLHKPGDIPNSCRNMSPISATRHKYELKQKIWPKQTVESWFANHTTDDRRAVYSFLNSLYDDDGYTQKEDRSSTGQHRKSPNHRSLSRVNTPVVSSSNHSLQRRTPNSGRHESRASKRDLGEILESLESLRPSLTSQERGVQTSATPITVPLPNVNGIKTDQKTERPLRRSKTSMDKYTETIPPQNSIDNPSNINEDNVDNKLNRRYLSHSWRVINPREDAEPYMRPENNRSSFFSYTRKVYPEYFFIHPEWY